MAQMTETRTVATLALKRGFHATGMPFQNLCMLLVGKVESLWPHQGQLPEEKKPDRLDKEYEGE